MISRSVLLIILSFISISLQAQRVTTKLLDKSWIAIKGETNVVDFSFRQDAKNFIKESMNIIANQQNNKITLSENVIHIEVKKFTSDDRMALDDFFKLVKASEYPNITVKLDHFESPDSQKENQTIFLNTHVAIYIAGIEKPYIIPIKVFKKGEVLKIEGSKKVNIKDFDLTPPNKLFGLIKVKEWIEIVFKINLEIKSVD